MGLLGNSIICMSREMFYKGNITPVIPPNCPCGKILNNCFVNFILTLKYSVSITSFIFSSSNSLERKYTVVIISQLIFEDYQQI